MEEFLLIHPIPILVQYCKAQFGNHCYIINANATPESFKRQLWFS